VQYYNDIDKTKTTEYMMLALSIQEKTLNENDPDLAVTYNHLGVFFDGCGKLVSLQRRTNTRCCALFCRRDQTHIV
jgi:hypothetical protein